MPITGKTQTIPNQVATITEIIYRFQGGIIPTVNNVQFDPDDMPDDYIDCRNISNFDITDAFRALQSGKKVYQQHMAEKKAKIAEEIALKEQERQDLLKSKAELDELKKQKIDK